MKELTQSDFSLLWPELRRWLPVQVTDVWMIGSASVAVVNPNVPAALRTSKDIDVIPVGTPVLYFDSTIMERELGEDSDFSSQHRFFVDYVSDSLLKWTPPGWQQRVTTLQLTAGLRGHCLDPHDIAYNKLYAGRPKDIVWVRGLLGTGIITWARLEELHAANPPRCGGPGKSGEQHGTSPGANLSEQSLRPAPVREKLATPPMTPAKIILGTRGSELALTQTTMVTAELNAAHPQLSVERQIIQTSGDKRQDLRFSEFSDVAQVDKGIFIKELEIALADSQIDAAVHSLKDVPSDLAAGFTIAAVLPRAAIEDVLVSAHPYTLETLPQGARIGTSSVRRAAQLKFLRPDVQIIEIRGNVPTRVKKVIGENALDAVLLAAAGLQRLGLMKDEQIQIEGIHLCALTLDPVKFLPAAGQGAIAIECRARDESTIKAIRALNHADTEYRITAEREFLKILGAGCQTPVGAHTWIKDGQLHMAVRVFNEADLALPPVEREAQRPVEEAAQLAADLAGML